MSKKIISADMAKEFVSKAKAAGYMTPDDIEPEDNAEFDNLFDIGTQDFTNYMATKFPDTYKTMKELPDAFYIADRHSLGTNYNSCFKDCAALMYVQWVFTHCATDLRYMFQGCTALPERMDCPIDCYSISDAAMLEGMFKDSGVKIARLDNLQIHVLLDLVSHKTKKITTLGIPTAVVLNGFYVEVAKYA